MTTPAAPVGYLTRGTSPVGCSTNGTRSSGIEVASIFREFGPAYRDHHRLRLQHLKVMTAIEKCRTSALGGHVDKCDTCDYEQPSYNSCGNRHCPKCGWSATEEWVAARMNELLPVTYFHVVFTIPHELNALALVNQKVIYGILFRAGSETLLDLGHDPRHLGGDLGLIAVLHTWGQNLMDHPHLHCLVPGGGLSPDCKEWLLPKNLSRDFGKMTKNKAFFIHVNVLSDLFKKKFLAYLKEAYQDEKLKFVGKIESLGEESKFKDLVNKLYEKGWIVYCKSPFSGPKKVLEYLARYTHRVAISNRRLIKLEGNQVTFKWWDYRDGKEKLMTLAAFEFIRRFLLHVLPKNFYRIRYYGILSSRSRKTKLLKCQELLGVEQLTDSDDEESSIVAEESTSEVDDQLKLCPKCQKGHLVRFEVSRPPRLLECASDSGPP